MRQVGVSQIDSRFCPRHVTDCPRDAVVLRDYDRSLLVAVGCRQINRPVWPNFDVSMNAGPMPVGRGINFDHWTEREPAVIAARTTRRWKLRTIVVRARRGAGRRRWKWGGQRQCVGTATNCLVIDSRSDPETGGRHPCYPA